MSRGLKFVRQVVNQVRMSNEDFDNNEGIKTDDVRSSADAAIEIRVLKADNEAQVRISSLEHDLVEIEGMHDGVGELMDAQAQVVEVKEAMESYLEKGGMTRDAALFASIALKNITERVFMPMAMPSMESFSGSSADRTDMTVVSMEAADSWYVKAWEAIKNFFKGIYDKIRGWFSKSEASNEDTKKAVAESKEVAEAAADVAPEATVEVDTTKDMKAEVEKKEGSNSGSTSGKSTSTVYGVTTEEAAQLAKYCLIECNGAWRSDSWGIEEKFKVSAADHIKGMQTLFVAKDHADDILAVLEACAKSSAKDGITKAHALAQKMGFSIAHPDKPEVKRTAISKLPIIGGNSIFWYVDKTGGNNAIKFGKELLKFVPDEKSKAVVKVADFRKIMDTVESSFDKLIEANKEAIARMDKAMTAIDQLASKKDASEDDKVATALGQSLVKALTGLDDMKEATAFNAAVLYYSRVIGAKFVDAVKKKDPERYKRIQEMKSKRLSEGSKLKNI